MEPGSYALLMEVEPTTIEVGALGKVMFEGAHYVYTGSAFGPGGLARIDRHKQVFEGGTASPHWHTDYLARAPASELVAVHLTEGEDLECRVAEELPGEDIEGFGCSDCSCRSHLIYNDELSELRSSLGQLHERCR